MNKIPCLLLAALVGVGSGCGDSDEAETTTNNAATNSTSEGNPQGGSDRATVALPDDLPSDVPILPDARPVHVGFMESSIGGQQKMYSIQLETSKSVEEVFAFYTTELPKQGWSLVHADPPAVVAEKPDKRFVQVQAGKNKDEQVGFTVHYR